MSTTLKYIRILKIVREKIVKNHKIVKNCENCKNQYLLFRWHNYDSYFDNILSDEKSYKNILIYDILCKTFIDAKPLPIMFDKVDGFIRDFDGTKYLILLGLEKYDAFMIGIDIL